MCQPCARRDQIAGHKEHHGYTKLTIIGGWLVLEWGSFRWLPRSKGSEIEKVFCLASKVPKTVPNRRIKHSIPCN
jgi:hypothetical protein